MTEYQGWTNHETRCVHLWLSKKEDTYKFWSMAGQKAYDAASDDETFSRLENARQMLAGVIKAAIEQGYPLEPRSLYSDLLTAAIGEVNWDEIATAFLPEVE